MIVWDWYIPQLVPSTSKRTSDCFGLALGLSLGIVGNKIRKCEWKWWQHTNPNTARGRHWDCWGWRYIRQWERRGYIKDQKHASRPKHSKRYPRVSKWLGGEVQQDHRGCARARNEHTRGPHAHGHCDEGKSHARECTGECKQTNEVDPGGPRALHGDIWSSVSNSHKHLRATLRAHDGDVWSSASNTSTHVRATSRAHDEHASHTIGSTAEIPLGIFLRVPCESGHTSITHARRQRPKPQWATNTREWKWEWRRHPTYFWRDLTLGTIHKY